MGGDLLKDRVNSSRSLRSEMVSFAGLDRLT